MGCRKKFREGQTTQVLDTLFFDFISLAKHLRPKVVIAENVVGLTMGKAKKYMEDIYSSFDDAAIIVLIIYLIVPLWEFLKREREYSLFV